MWAPGIPLVAGDIRNTSLAHPKTKFKLREWSSRTDWEQYRSHLRLQILGAAGLLPLPERGPVNATIHRETVHDDWISEAGLFETLPGYFVGGTIYRPRNVEGRLPAVLLPHGHWHGGRVEDTESYSVPALGILLARQGYVAFAWDMVGYNDTTQTPHDFGGQREKLWGFSPLGLQLWNSLRAFDYVRTRRDVDARYIACTGASGGATQTILLTAVEPGICCSAPVNMVSADYQGADPCEEAPNLRLGTNNVEIAAMMAPRPMLLVSCTGDWTRHTPTVEFPAIRSIYGLFNASKRVLNAHFDAEHNYNRDSRAAVCRFLDQWIPSPSGRPRNLEERDSGDITKSELLVFQHSPKRNYETVFRAWRAPRNEGTTTDQRLALRVALGAEWPEQTWTKGSGQKLTIGRSGAGDSISVSWNERTGTPIVAVHEDGYRAALERVPPDRTVLALDAFGTGSGHPDREGGGKWYLSYNQTTDANRVQDILTAMQWVESRTGMLPELMGFDRAAVWCTFAAAIAPRTPVLSADLNDFHGTEEDFEKQFFVPCILRAGGLTTALRLVVDAFKPTP